MKIGKQRLRVAGKRLPAKDATMFHLSLLLDGLFRLFGSSQIDRHRSEGNFDLWTVCFSGLVISIAFFALVISFLFHVSIFPIHRIFPIVAF